MCPIIFKKGEFLGLQILIFQ
uniref:Uncharacterized protein n=1 Tax=Anguilla anguilla TaxID=7936 RepID=A0A0E9VGV2_ANGAN